MLNLRRRVSQWRNRLHRAIVVRSGLFDPLHYLATFPDVAASGADPLDHYCTYGWREKRAPGPRLHMDRVAAWPLARWRHDFDPVVAWYCAGRWLGWQPGWRQRAGWAVAGRASRSPDAADIVIVLHEATRTGAPMFALRFARWLRDSAGWQPVFVVLAGGSLLAEFLAEFPCFLLFALAVDEREARLGTALRDRRILYFNSLASLGAWRWLRGDWQSVVVHCHEARASLGDYAVEMAALAACRPTVVTVDAPGSAALARAFATDPAIIPPSIDVDAGQRASRSKRVERTRLVVGCGKASHRKGADLFCELVARMDRMVDHDVRFCWVGGEADIDMAELSAQMGLGHRMELTGEVQDPLPWLAKASVVVVPSREDPFPLVALEAASCGVPIVCFDSLADGVGQLAAAGAGAMVPAFDVAAMADAVGGFLDDVDLRAKAGAVAARSAEAYDMQAIGPRIMKQII